ncbi:MAG: hypothetical protein K5657_08080 [Desulfovibrio sp.]|nr:hypothetical protein [Desulfovibrio sp.]
MTRLVLSVILIFVSLALGYCYREHILRASPNRKTEPQILLSLRDRLQFIAFFLFIPLSSMLSLWGLPKPDERFLLLPLLGILAWTTGGAASLLIANFLKYNNASKGSLFCCGTFSNIGAVGTLICVVFFGEKTIAYVALYRLFEELFYYGLAIPVASRYKGDPSCQVRVQGMRISRLLVCIVLALVLGLVLNYLSVPRPQFLGYIAAFLSILAAVLALFSIGLGLKLSTLRNYTESCIIICSIKFFIVPICIMTVAYFLGFSHLDEGLPFKVILILSSMPVAMNALLPPALLKLDLHLANACWIASTLALALVLPVLSLVVLPILETVY